MDKSRALVPCRRTVSDNRVRECWAIIYEENTALLELETNGIQVIWVNDNDDGVQRLEDMFPAPIGATFIDHSEATREDRHSIIYLGSESQPRSGNLYGIMHHMMIREDNPELVKQLARKHGHVYFDHIQSHVKRTSSENSFDAWGDEFVIHWGRGNHERNSVVYDPSHAQSTQKRRGAEDRSATRKKEAHERGSRLHEALTLFQAAMANTLPEEIRNVVSWRSPHWTMSNNQGEVGGRLLKCIEEYKVALFFDPKNKRFKREAYHNAITDLFYITRAWRTAEPDNVAIHQAHVDFAKVIAKEAQAMKIGKVRKLPSRKRKAA